VSAMHSMRSIARSTIGRIHAGGREAAVVEAVMAGLWNFYTGRPISAEARRSVLDLHCRTNGRSSDYLARMLRVIRPPRRPKAVSGVLGHLSVDDQRRIAGALERDGFWVFDRLAPTELCDDIEKFAAITPAYVEGRGRTVAERVVFDPAAPVSRTYHLPEADIIQSKGIQRLIGDPGFLAIAEMHLRTHPIFARANLWWSAPYGEGPGTDAAQLFHFDFDPPPMWLHFFVYLRDVGPKNGPHVYVRGSHKPGHPSASRLRARGYVRIPDDEIASAFGRENIVEFHGPRGTILCVDTRGFHKGKMLTAGCRLMAQFIFAFPPFSLAYETAQVLPRELDPVFAEARRMSPRVYDKYRVAPA
jgi:hypothetical protein